MFTSLLQMLDHPKIDFYIHMDAKNKSYDPAETLKLVKFSRVVHTPRTKVSWGSYSQIEAEMILLEAATSQGHYEHYHLLSGADLPIKRVDEIISFFERNHGLEFVSFDKESVDRRFRVKYYYPFQELKGRKGSLIIRVLSKACLMLQKLLRVHRNKGIAFQKGAQWFSITDELARYVLSKREWVRKIFHDALLGEEMFLHTLVINSEFRDRLYHKELDNDTVKGVMRLIDWERFARKQLVTFTIADLEQITSSPAMFARKFDPSVDSQVIEEIRKLYS